MPEPITIDLVGCARCHGEGHPELTFVPLTYPVEIPRGDMVEYTLTFTHWAPCPNNGEPIMFATDGPIVTCDR